MMIRPSTGMDLEPISNLLEIAFGKNRYDKTFARHWVQCFLGSPMIFPSFVAADTCGNILGYIVWKVRRVTNNGDIVIELQEMAAVENVDKLDVEEALYNDTPAQVVASAGIKSLAKCTIYVWVHDEDVHNNKSIFFKSDKEALRFHGVYEKDDARGGMFRLYKKHLLFDADNGA